MFIVNDIVYEKDNQKMEFKRDLSKLLKKNYLMNNVSRNYFEMKNISVR